MPRPLLATIDIEAMRCNLAVVRAYTPHAKIWAVVKANAYGHGLMRGLRGFEVADGLGLVEFDGAVRLREMGWTKPILMLEGFYDPSDLVTAAQYQFDISVHCAEQVEMLEKIPLSSSMNIHLQMNSGMNRLGFSVDSYRLMHQRVRAIPTVRTITLMTHFSNADRMKHSRLSVAEQTLCFQRGADSLGGEVSLSNSGAILLHPELATDWVRPGIMLYGATPGTKTAQEFGLQPTMTLTSRVMAIQEIAVGDSVGYGSRFVADKRMRIGVVACGYADGYPRHAPDGTPVVVDGIRTRLVGTVSMDMMAVDLTAVPAAHVGSGVTLWGIGLPIDDVANAAGTIGYELMCALAARVSVVER